MHLPLVAHSPKLALSNYSQTSVFKRFSPQIEWRAYSTVSSLRSVKPFNFVGSSLQLTTSRRVCTLPPTLYFVIPEQLMNRFYWLTYLHLHGQQLCETMEFSESYLSEIFNYVSSQTGYSTEMYTQIENKLRPRYYNGN